MLKNANWCLVAGGDELIILTNYLYYCANTMQQLVHHVPIYVIAKLSLFFSFFHIFRYKNILFMRFSMRKDSLLLLFSALSLSRPLSQYLCINLRSYSKKIFSRCIFFHSLRLLFVLRAFYALHSTKLYWGWECHAQIQAILFGYSVNNICRSAFKKIDVNSTQDTVHKMQYPWYAFMGRLSRKRQTQTLTNSSHLMDALYD